MRRLIWTVGVLAVAGAGFAAVTVAGAESGTRYRVASVTTGDVSQTVLTSGTVDHVNRADLSFGTSGTVAGLSVTVGTSVSVGQELGTLDTASLQAAVDKATADVDEAESNLSAASSAVESTDPSSEDLVREVKDAQTAASAAMKTAADAVAAQAAACVDPAAAACASAGSATLTAQQAVKAAQDTLQAKLDALSAVLSAPSSDSPSAGSVAEAQAAVDEANVKLVEAQQALAGATLTSPVTGTVASVSAAVGDQVSTGDAVAVVIGEGAAEVSATVSVEQLRVLVVGQSATVTPVGTSEKVPGTVTRVGTLPDANAESVAYPVTITVDDPPATMAAGTSATAAVTVATAEDVLAVPTSAVNRSTVTVLNADGTTTVTRVAVGAVGPTRTEIKEGVSAGDQVVLANLDAPVPTSDQQNTGPLNGGGPDGGGGPGGGPMMRQGPSGR